MADRPHEVPDISRSLSWAMVASSDAPLLLLDGDLRVIAASASFCRSFHIDPSSLAGRSVLEIGAGEWNIRQLRSLLRATAAGSADIESYELDLKSEGGQFRRLVLKARKLDYGDLEHVRLLVTVIDVTNARAAEKLKDNALREKAVLLQELQHRVANSLQIIASVLMQSARRVQSEEVRGHLRQAHDRVMSVAAVKHQLAASALGDVALRPYLTQLCESISASMISDPGEVSLQVISDESTVDPDVSISLGLIATELVINAVKHAFPDGRRGKIVVKFHAQGLNWTLSVGDDGVGLPKGRNPTKAGLGTSIVEALSKQLHAHVQIIQAPPGTTISIVHAQIGVVDEDKEELAV